MSVNPAGRSPSPDDSVPAHFEGDAMDLDVQNTSVVAKRTFSVHFEPPPEEERPSNGGGSGWTEPPANSRPSCTE